MILIIGLGKTGISAIKYLKKKDIEIAVFDEDKNNLQKIQEISPKTRFIEKAKDLQNLIIDFAICSPGFQTKYNQNEVVKYLQVNNITIKSDLDIFLENIKQSKIIAITGTNGKSTTTALLSHTLSKLGKTSIACGNIGLPILEIDEKKYEYICFEASSANLEISQNPSFYAGFLTNITNDHIKYHGNIENYIEAKKRVFIDNSVSFCSNSDNFCKEILSENTQIKTISNTEILQSGVSFCDGFFYKNGQKLSLDANKMQIIGEHNIQNALFVINFCLHEGFEVEKIFDAICSFPPLKHRLQLVKNIGNMSFINDSKATNVDSTAVALSSISDVYLIAGGVSKYPHSILDLKEFFPKITHFFLIGEAANEFFEDLNGENATICNSMEGAVKSAYKLAITNIKNKKSSSPKILLSPLCASFDMYKNFEERGDDFIGIVENL